MPDRREFLSALSAGALPFVEHDQPPADSAFMGMIPRESNPPNFETHPKNLADPITQTQAFYVRNHFPTPKIEEKSWRLKIEGAVERPITLTLEDIREIPSTTRTLTMECAGNGRVYLVPKVRGVNWADGAVGTAKWTGVVLEKLLALVNIRKSAVEVILEGADIGSVNDDPKSPGPIAFARSLPLEKARRPEVILATHMNGEVLTRDHGWPLRAIVGGWYGMASVKWLNRIIVRETPYQGFWQTMDYSQFENVNGLPTLKPITAMRVKSVILEPRTGTLHKDGPISGVAWAGEHAVAKVEVSTDGGKTWQKAQLSGKPEPMVWVHWECRNPKFGEPPYRLLSRATDTAGNTQPTERDPNRRTYQINHMIPIEVN